MGWLGLGKSKQRGALPARDAPLAWLFDGERLTALKYRDGETHSSFGGWYGLSGTNAESYARAYMTSVWAFRAIALERQVTIINNGRAEIAAG